MYAPEVLQSIRKGHVVDQGPMAIEWLGQYDSQIYWLSGRVFVRAPELEMPARHGKTLYNHSDINSSSQRRSR